MYRKKKRSEYVNGASILILDFKTNINHDMIALNHMQTSRCNLQMIQS